VRIQARICALSALLGALLLLGGCTETFQLIWRTRIGKPVAKSLPAPSFRLTILDWPSTVNPTVSVKVEQQKFWIETAKKIRKQFKKYDDGRFVAVSPPREESQSMARVTGKTEWIPAPGVEVVFRAGSGGADNPMMTNEEGIASFDVTPFCEMWIEGRDLQVEVSAELKSIMDDDPWRKVKGKPPKALKSLKIKKQPFVDNVQVEARILQKIFEKR